MGNFLFRKPLAPMLLGIAVLAFFFPVNSSQAATAIVRDGATVQLAGITYGLMASTRRNWIRCASTITPIPGPAASKRATN